MAIMTVRSTYALDPETVRRLDGVARKWGVSKSEALRRAIRAAAHDAAEPAAERLKALDQLQKAMGLTARSANTWARRVRDERDASKKRTR